MESKKRLNGGNYSCAESGSENYLLGRQTINEKNTLWVAYRHSRNALPKMIVSPNLPFQQFPIDSLNSWTSYTSPIGRCACHMLSHCTAIR